MARRALRFVVHEHHARRLHYDLRLEAGGVLKSWAVPKGPSMSPADRRLAILVADHPIDYAGFEGIIPEGHYGAGAVAVWDEGTYAAVDGSPIEEKVARRQPFSFVLAGRKLRGEFALVPLGGGDLWLLIKKRDGDAPALRRPDDADRRSSRRSTGP